MTVEQIVSELKRNYNQNNIDGMGRFGINVDKAFGLSAPMVKAIAKSIGKNHELALKLWESGYHEARQVAFLIDEPNRVTKSQMNKWVKDFHSWDICDGTCCYLFERTPYAIDKIFEWVDKKDEYVKRAAFSLMAYMAVHQKARDDKDFLEFFPLIKKYSTDERNFVKKAVNWALRQIGKRSMFLNKKAMLVAEEIAEINSKSARWIAKDAIRELSNPKILARIKR